MILWSVYVIFEKRKKIITAEAVSSEEPPYSSMELKLLLLRSVYIYNMAR